MSARYGKYLRETATGKLLLDRGAIADAQRYDGKWVITSNDDTLSPEDLALGYKQLLRVEQCWRQLKSGLHMARIATARPTACARSQRRAHRARCAAHAPRPVPRCVHGDPASAAKLSIPRVAPTLWPNAVSLP
ncbi:MAG TPA: hypothetical protein VF331_19155 [Polyangiales bacterium]